MFLTQLIVQLNNTTVPAGQVETLTTDHGGEVISKVFQDWLRHRGIFHMTAPRREPNYNAIIERSSAVVENMAFAMLTHAKKPKSWWDYAFDWATYVLDRCPRKSNQQHVTPFEAYFQEKPDLKDIRIFGCLCFALVHPEDHLHLEPRAQRGVFVGIDEERRSYRVILDGARKYTVARSVVFYEQSLVHAMRESIGLTVSDGSTSNLVPQGLVPHTLSSEGLQNNILGTEQQDGSHSSSDLSTHAQAKLQSPTGRDLLTSRKALFLTPTPPAVVGEGILDPQPKRLHGK